MNRRKFLAGLGGAVALTALIPASAVLADGALDKPALDGALDKPAPDGALDKPAFDGALDSVAMDCTLDQFTGQVYPQAAYDDQVRVREGHWEKVQYQVYDDVSFSDEWGRDMAFDAAPIYPLDTYGTTRTQIAWVKGRDRAFDVMDNPDVPFEPEPTEAELAEAWANYRARKWDYPEMRVDATSYPGVVLINGEPVGLPASLNRGVLSYTPSYKHATDAANQVADVVERWAAGR